MSELVVDAVPALVTPEPPAEPPADAAALARSPDGALLDADLLIEDVSIDGMCGVY